METLIGFIMIYSWVHGTIIVIKKIANTTQYENAVLVVGVIGFALYVLGTM